MSAFHCTVVKVGPVRDLADSDNLAITEVYGEGGYPCIVRRGEMKQGDLAIYIPIDSLVPDNEMFHFLAPLLPVGQVPARARSIQAKKLRGTFSMGLLIPALPNMVEGQDVTETLGISRIEPKDSMSHLGYTDIEGLRRWPSALIEGEEVVIHEKLHGECLRAAKIGGVYQIGSRTSAKDDGHFVKAADSIGLKEKLPDQTVVFGEAIGHVGGFPYGQQRGRITARLFDSTDPRTKKFHDYDVFSGMCQERGLPMAPLLYRGPWHSALRELVNGPSELDPSHIREGIVAKPVVERWDPRLGRVILKLHSHAFLLKTKKGAV